MAADLTQTFWGKHFEKIILAAAIVIFVVAAVWFLFGRAVGITPREALREQVEKAVANLATPKNAPDTFLTDAKLKELGLTDEQVKKVMALPTVSADELKKLGLPEEKVRGITLLKVLPPAEQQSLGVGQPPVTVKDFATELNGLPAAWDAGHDAIEKVVAVTQTTGPQEPFRAPRVVSASNLQAVTGRGTTDEPVQYSIFKLDKYSDILWAGVTGIVNLTEQLEAFRAAKDPVQPVMISRVELQRRELKPDGSWSPWQPVVPAVTATAAAKWPKMPDKPRDTRAVMQWGADVGTQQVVIRHMPLYHLVAVDEEGRLVEAAAGAGTGTEQPDLTPPKPPEAAPAAAPEPAPDVPPPAAPAVGGQVNPWAAPTGPASKGGPAAGLPIPPPPPHDAGGRHVTTAVWAYDISVEPGKTYQYQMRVGIRSPIYNLDRAEPAVRWMPEFVGDWSPASREVTLPSTVLFYFVGTFGDKANIELQRWVLGQWIRVPSVPTSLGAPVVVTPPKRQKLLLPGGSGKFTTDNVEIDMNPAGIVLVDILRNFLYQPEGGGMRATRTNALIFADARGELGQRIEWVDKTDAATRWKEREGAVGAPVPIKPPPVTPPPPKIPPKTPPRPTSTKG